MPSLSQALHLGDLPFPHSAFQDHATHTAGWPACLGPTAHGVPVYLKVLLHSSIMLHGAVRLPSTGTGYRPVSSNGTDMCCSAYLFICGVYEYAEFTPLSI